MKKILKLVANILIFMIFFALMNIQMCNKSNVDALQTYQRIVRGSDESYNNGIENEDKEGGIELEKLKLIYPEKKNNMDLVIYAVNAFNSGWGYVWGTYGDVLTDADFTANSNNIRTTWRNTRISFANNGLAAEQLIVPAL